MFVLFELLAGIALGVGVGTAAKAIGSGGGLITGKNNVNKYMRREERNCVGRFNNLQITNGDPKFYE